jgi:membrane-associated phospholipid phosphatase
MRPAVAPFLRWTMLLLFGVSSVSSAQAPRRAAMAVDPVLRFQTWPSSNAPPLANLRVPAARPHVVRWWEAAAVALPALGLTAADENVTHELREHRTSSAEDVASVFRRVGQPEVYAVLPLSVLTAGLLTHDAEITRAGGRLAATVAVSTVAFTTLKLLVGRARPDAREGAFAFHPFSGRGALPSGHSTIAFALATSLADDLHNPWAATGLYLVAAGTAWSRVYDERHWPSDVVLGAALGITTSKVLSGRWRVFGLHPPGFLVEPGGAGLSFELPLH